MTEGERLIKLETQMDNIENKVDDGFKSSKEDLQEVKSLITEFIKESESRFAAHWTEDAIKWTVVTIIGAVLTAGLYFLLKH